MHAFDILANWLETSEPLPAIDLPTTPTIIDSQKLEEERISLKQSNGVMQDPNRHVIVQQYYLHYARHILVMKSKLDRGAPLTVEPTLDPYLITLDFLTKTQTLSTAIIYAKIEALFQACLAPDYPNKHQVHAYIKEILTTWTDAADFYRQHRALLQQFEIDERKAAVVQEVQQEKTALQTARDNLTRVLIAQGPLLNFQRLIIRISHDPIEFAAYIILLLENKISAEEIMQSGLLHRYFSLANRDNFLKMYACLQTEALAKPLLEKVHQTNACAVNDEAVLEITKEARELKAKYTLDGTLITDLTEQAQQDLQQVTIIPLEGHYSAQLNFQALYAYFGMEFLDEILLFYVEQHRAFFIPTLSPTPPPPDDFSLWLTRELHTLAQHPQTRRQFGSYLAQLGNNIEDSSRPFNRPLMAAIAWLMDEASLECFLVEKSPEILYLLPFRPQIIEHFSAETLDDYLKMLSRSLNFSTVIPQLIALYHGIAQTNQALQKKVYIALLQLIIDNRQHDLHHNEPLPRFFEENLHREVIRDQLMIFSEELISEIDAMLQLPQITREDLASLKEKVRTRTSLMQFFSQFFPFSYPQNEFDLGRFLVERKIALAGMEAFNLKDFLLSITSLPSEAHREQSSEFGEILVEIIAATPIEALREQAFTLLALPCIHQPTIDSALRRAAERGQSSSVRRICALYTPSQEVVEKAFFNATHLKQWGVIEALCQISSDNQPSQLYVSLAFLKASEAKSVSTIRVMLSMEGPNKPTGEIDSFFMQIMKNERWRMLTEIPTKFWFSYVTYYIDSSSLSKDEQKWDFVNFLLSLPEAKDISQYSLASLLFDAAQEGNLDMVKKLWEMETPNRPELARFGQACLFSVTHPEISEFLNSQLPVEWKIPAQTLNQFRNSQQQQVENSAEVSPSNTYA